MNNPKGPCATRGITKKAAKGHIVPWRLRFWLIGQNVRPGRRLLRRVPPGPLRRRDLAHGTPGRADLLQRGLGGLVVHGAIRENVT